MTVVQNLANVRPTATHLFEPRLGEAAHRVIGLGKPGVDVGVAPNGGR
jgi:hypothetical protein